MAKPESTRPSEPTQAKKCAQCGNPAAAGKSRCESCAASRREQARRQAEELYRKGLCRQCKGALDGPNKLCAACRTWHLEKTTERQARNRKAGRCPRCGGEPEPGRAQCASCLARDKARDAGRPRQERRCRDCGGGPLPPKRHFCETCRKRRHNRFVREYRQRLLAAGTCPQCCKSMDREGSVCSRCLARMKGRLLRLKQKCFAGYGGKCQCCGTDEVAFLTLDHVNDDGAAKRRSGEYPGTGTGAHFYSWVIRQGFPKDLACLCFNCNWGKRLCGSCPCGGKRT